MCKAFRDRSFAGLGERGDAGVVGFVLVFEGEGGIMACLSILSVV